MITTCKFCKQNISEARGCGSNPLVGHNERWQRIPYGHEIENVERKPTEACEGCNIVLNGYHHVYCPVEECPRCNGKLNICQCFYTMKEENK
jgi:hypothetical protein